MTRFAWRRSIECTFQESRAHPRAAATRGWSRRTVLRSAPCLYGLSPVVALLYHAPPEAKRSGGVLWPGKSAATFSDAVYAVRLWIWTEGVFPQGGARFGLRKVPDRLRELLEVAFAPAA